MRDVFIDGGRRHWEEMLGVENIKAERRTGGKVESDRK